MSRPLTFNLLLLGRLTYLSADLGFTGILLLSFFALYNFRARWTELNYIRHMVGSKCDLKMHVRNVDYNTPYKLGAQNSVFRRLRNVISILAAYIFGTKQAIHNLASALTTTRDILHTVKMAWTLVHKWLQIGPSFYPPYTWILPSISLPGFAEGHQQTELNQTLPNGGC